MRDLLLARGVQGAVFLLAPRALFCLRFAGIDFSRANRPQFQDDPIFGQFEKEPVGLLGAFAGTHFTDISFRGGHNSAYGFRVFGFGLGFMEGRIKNRER